MPVVWRTFEVTTRVEVLKPSGTTRVWLPAALLAPFQRTLANDFKAEGGTAELVENKADVLGIVVAEFPAGVKPAVTLTSRITTRNYEVDLSKPTEPGKEKDPSSEYFLRPTKLMPTDGIVKVTSDEITVSKKTDVAKARAIYEWIVEISQSRDTRLRHWRHSLHAAEQRSGRKVRGSQCTLRRSRPCSRASRSRRLWYPGRQIRTRIQKPRASTPNITKAQHCRAEVYLREYGWFPVDPADVRKVVLEELQGNRSLDDDMVKTVLFGAWEMNWMAYNFAHDVALPASKGGPVGFLMYPQAETAEGSLDCLDPDNFKYEIGSREILPNNG